MCMPTKLANHDIYIRGSDVLKCACSSIWGHKERRRKHFHLIFIVMMSGTVAEFHLIALVEGGKCQSVEMN